MPLRRAAAYAMLIAIGIIAYRLIHRANFSELHPTKLLSIRASHHDLIPEKSSCRFNHRNAYSSGTGRFICSRRPISDSHLSRRRCRRELRRGDDGFASACAVTHSTRYLGDGCHGRLFDELDMAKSVPATAPVRFLRREVERVGRQRRDPALVA